MPKKTELSEDDKALRNEIGVAIRSHSSSQKVKPQDLARVAGVSLAHQYRIEGGETTPDALYLVKIARHLGISIDALVTAHHLEQRGAVGVVQTNSGAGAVQAGRNANTAGNVSGQNVQGHNNQVNTAPGAVQIRGKGNVVVPRK